MQSEMHVTGFPAYSDQREHVGQLIGAALQAADPEAAVRRHLSLQPDGVRVGQRVFPLTLKSKLYVIALGKAAPAMVRAACDVLGARLEAGIATALTSKPTRLPDRVQPEQVVGLLLSDVVGNDPASIASGPTVTRASRHGTGRQMLERYGCWDPAPQAVRQALSRSIARPRVSPSPHNLVIARNEDMLHAVAHQARAIGFPTKILTARMQGEAFTVGERLGTHLASAPRPICLLAGGETTVTIRQGGRGGRNQELALGSALALDGQPRCALVALASDGIDGPTDAAGAWVDGETVARARALGLNPREAAQAHDSYPLLDQLGALLRTGPTGTNLTDLVIGLAYS
ncbi:MAG: DUF4147 domain-containing protein [Chloroflexi bacterium]|nr:DUF4147 domain-containing protein [Chloroflexota bacterium]